MEPNYTQFPDTSAGGADPLGDLLAGKPENILRSPFTSLKFIKDGGSSRKAFAYTVDHLCAVPGVAETVCAPADAIAALALREECQKSGKSNEHCNKMFMRDVLERSGVALLTDIASGVGLTEHDFLASYSATAPAGFAPLEMVEEALKLPEDFVPFSEENELPPSATMELPPEVVIKEVVVRQKGWISKRQIQIATGLAALVVLVALLKAVS